jgi:bifunctional DNA-binding transcriptional regulator/antitoxin component of YhaV-PrlF toxin-antitoxin module
MKRIFTMKLRRISTHSYAVTLPKDIIRKFKWRGGQKLELIEDGGYRDIRIRDWRGKK